MRVLIYGINYTPEITGIGKYTGEMGEWLAERGHEVRVVTAPPYYPYWQVGKGYFAWAYRRERVAETDVWRCPLWVPFKPSGIKRLLHLISFAASSFPIILWHIPWRPNVVILIEPPLLCAPWAWITARAGGARMWLHIQDFELDAALGLGMLGGTMIQRVLRRVEGFLITRSSIVSTITQAMRRRVIEKGVPADRTWLFPNWSDIDFVYPMRADNEVRQEFGIKPQDVLVLYAGNMGEKQGLDLVLDVAYQLREQTEIKFAMVGNGAGRKRLERVAIQRKLYNVRFFPIQSLERLPLMLAAGDIHLIVQRREAADLVMPSKLTNILAAGRPCVATADPGTTLHDVLNNHRCGITTPPGSVKELVASIATLVEDPKMRQQLGRNARLYAETHLAKDRILAEFEKGLQELVDTEV